jgi:hypothetical protein
VFLGIAAIPAGVLLLCAGGLFAFFAWAGAHKENPEIVGIFAMVAAVVALLGCLPLYLGATALGTAALNHAVARAFENQSITIRDALKDAWRRGWGYCGLYLLQALIIWIAPLAIWCVLVLLGAFAVALAQTAGSGALASGLLGLMAIVVVLAMTGYCIWMFLRLSLAFPASVVESISPTAALKRSSTLSQGTRGRIFLLYLLGTVLNYILMFVFILPVFIILALIPHANNPENEQATGMANIFIVYGGSFVIQAVTRPVFGIALMLFYYDQRIRKEGFDIEWMMQQAGMMPPTPVQMEAAPWLPPISLHAPPPEAVALPEAIAPPPAELPAYTVAPAPSEETL